jgi:indole-3-glycerol phosphate synthase
MNTAGITTTGTILDKIVARKIEEVAAIKIDWPWRGDAMSRKRRNFVGALKGGDTLALIAEIKHASPSKGVLIEHFDPVALSTEYAEHGAAAISVLTDRDFFQGSLDDLKAVRKNVAVPILRKDFVIDWTQISEARHADADAVLLIAAILDDDRLSHLAMAAWDHGVAALIEVHTEKEMERALEATYGDSPLIGINNRDLHTFKVDLNVTRRLAAMAPPDVTLVAESGIFTAEDVESMAAAGVDAILVGESIVKSPDIGAQIRTLSGVQRQGRRS